MEELDYNATLVSFVIKCQSQYNATLTAFDKKSFNISAFDIAPLHRVGYRN
jgi:hypothetical protein